MDTRRFPMWLAVLVSALGIALHAYIGLFKADDGPSAFSLGLMVWSSIPYVACLVLAFYGRGNPLPAFLGGAAALCFDASVYYSVFVAPTSSTAALALLFAPVVNAAVLVPVGMLVGLGLGKWLGRNAREAA